MYQIGSYVIYGIQGVCKVAGTETRLVNGKETEYLILESAEKEQLRYYLPTHNAAAMGKLKAVLCAQEMEQILASDEIREDCWIWNENQRKQHYRDLISRGDRTSILQMLHNLYQHKQKQMESGRKFHQCDDNFLRDAERLVSREVALAMGMANEEALAYLRAQLMQPKVGS